MIRGILVTDADGNSFENDEQPSEHSHLVSMLTANAVVLCSGEDASCLSDINENSQIVIDATIAEAKTMYPNDTLVLVGNNSVTEHMAEVDTLVQVEYHQSGLNVDTSRYLFQDRKKLVESIDFSVYEIPQQPTE